MCAFGDELLLGGVAAIVVRPQQFAHQRGETMQPRNEAEATPRYYPHWGRQMVQNATFLLARASGVEGRQIIEEQLHVQVRFGGPTCAIRP